MARTFQTVTAGELRNGDLLRLGTSENFVLIADAQTDGEDVALTIYNGPVPNKYGPTLRYLRSKPLELSMRDAKP